MKPEIWEIKEVADCLKLNDAVKGLELKLVQKRDVETC